MNNTIIIYCIILNSISVYVIHMHEDYNIYRVTTCFIRVILPGKHTI